ncbi:hypothetical protein GUJ93_ZPchr0009g314 [Zizania palustris]|uniref:Uncharacterized protein n=1 Tax=Zizania palustris TaxID=103762 RepID=A0A8J5VKV5_ZIZPA|nr:hypothetical protein GUJ93_ZPchr0009g314 [Zizania palustris]
MSWHARPYWNSTGGFMRNASHTPDFMSPGEPLDEVWQEDLEATLSAEYGDEDEVVEELITQDARVVLLDVMKDGRGGFGKVRLKGGILMAHQEWRWGEGMRCWKMSHFTAFVTASSPMVFLCHHLYFLPIFAPKTSTCVVPVKGEKDNANANTNVVRVRKGGRKQQYQNEQQHKWKPKVGMDEDLYTVVQFVCRGH